MEEASMDRVHKMVQSSKDPRNCVVGEPPPVPECPSVINPYPGPAESPDYIDIGPGYQHKDLYRYMK